MLNSTIKLFLKKILKYFIDKITELFENFRYQNYNNKPKDVARRYTQFLIKDKKCKLLNKKICYTIEQFICKIPFETNLQIRLNVVACVIDIFDHDHAGHQLNDIISRTQRGAILIATDQIKKQMYLYPIMTAFGVS